MKRTSKWIGILAATAITLSQIPSNARASVLGTYYLTEQIRLNHLGYTHNILPVTLPTGEVCKISYYHHRSSKGERRTLLLHGFLDRAVTWRHAIAQIPDSSPLRKNLILVDLPNHGDSKCDSVSTFTEAEEFLKLGIATIRAKEKFKVDGMWTGSLGGLFGLALLNTYPEAQLTMIVPPLLAEPYADLKRKEIDAITTRETLAQFLNKVPPPSQRIPLVGVVVSGLLPRAPYAKRIVQHIDASLLWSGYMKTSKPVRILVSSDDALLPINEMDPKFIHNFKSEYQVISGCGHSILRFCSDRATPFLLNETHTVDTGIPAATAALKTQGI